MYAYFSSQRPGFNPRAANLGFVL